ncbi:Aste57867_11155 [Aphanomyces stellatus]|uniref:Aste57867_11155 protein n=1 Tax=Aphanomyces stellatus TaxID=120398 RepID=A0A485KSV6_9STRA|nr:hypothetical protein As57867_011113 [Aphanomyces stellatus]VFT88022.1 Aste57867_11155 [Aphanomyces stellatus]
MFRGNSTKERGPSSKDHHFNTVSRRCFQRFILLFVAPLALLMKTTAAAFALSFASALAVDSTQFFTFDSAGVQGHVQFIYRFKEDTFVGADINAALDVTSATWDVLAKSNANCTGPIQEFKWHIHTVWANPPTATMQSSAALGDCSLAKAGNHYDPLFACGPNSEHATHPKCKPITPTYKCTPASYKADPKTCEKGDLSGKFGTMKNVNNHIQGSWFDAHFPDPSEVTPSWNVMLHAVCAGGDTPRFVCAAA